MGSAFGSVATVFLRISQRGGGGWSNVTYYTANVGVRSATIDPYGPEGRARIRELLREADTFHANRRPGYLEKIGLSAEEAAAIRPGIIHVSISLAGETGHWARRVGFDQTAGALSGIMLAEGENGAPALPAISVVNDYVLSWLATTGIIAALMRRATEGGSYRVTLNLRRVSAWILSLGLFDRAYATRSLVPADPTPHTPTSTPTPSPPTPPAATTRASPTKSSCPAPPAASAPSWYPAAAANSFGSASTRRPAPRRGPRDQGRAHRPAAPAQGPAHQLPGPAPFNIKASGPGQDLRPLRNPGELEEVEELPDGGDPAAAEPDILALRRSPRPFEDRPGRRRRNGMWCLTA